MIAHKKTLCGYNTQLYRYVWNVDTFLVEVTTISPSMYLFYPVFTYIFINFIIVLPMYINV